ncbi:MAG: hypothetical protein ACJ8IK_13250 [Burkholderiaceae bacterium]|jgi:hypothetical protein
MATQVFFFGGFLASHTDMKVWAGDAASQRSSVDFRAFPWPSGAKSDARSGVAGAHNSGSFRQAVHAIKGSTADTIFIVGHSSGCAIANAVDADLSDHERVALVALDGFAPDGTQRSRASTQVWAAECGEAVSRNHKALQALLGGKLKIYTATDCKTAWGLHFSLVNARADSKTTISNGYKGCRANLCWL